MKIIVVGLGETGQALIKLLEGSGHDITVIDKNRDCVEMITDKFCANGVVGSGASQETLLKAGADTADVLVALTHTDEINLISCMQAKAVGTKHCAARLLMPDLVAEEERLREKYSIDFFVKPKLDLADDICRNIGLPGNVKLENCLNGAVNVIDLNVMEESPSEGKTVAQLKELVPDMDIRVIARDKKALAIKDDTKICAGDTLFIAASEADTEKVLRSLQIRRDRTKDVVIVGGHTTTDYLTAKLLEKGMKIKILDDDIDRCRRLMDRYPSVNVSYADGEITEVLEEERVDKADAVVSLTENDESNLVISLYAWSKGIPCVITGVDKQRHVKLLHKVNIDITVSATEYSVFGIIRYLSDIANTENDKDAQIDAFISDLRRF